MNFAARLRRPTSWLFAVYLVVIAFFFIGYVLLPIVDTVMESFGDDGQGGISSYIDFFSSALNQTVVLNTLAVGVLSVITCGVVGCVLAVYVRFFCKHCRRLIQVLLMTPVMVPGVIITIAFMLLYGESGMITHAISWLAGSDSVLFSFGGLSGIVMVITYTQYVYFYLNVYTALGQIDGNVVDSVRSLGGGWWRIFKDAILPAIAPSLVISAMTTFVSAIGSYSAPALIGNGYRVLTTQVVAAKSTYNMELASIEVVVLLAIGVAVTLIVLGIARLVRTKKAPRAVVWRPNTSRHRGVSIVFTVIAIVQVVLVVLPVVVVFYLSFMSTSSIMTEIFPTGLTLENYEQVFTNRRTFQPLANSFTMAAIAIAITLICTVPVAYASRRRASPSASVMEWALMIPWCMPASVIAIGLINTFSQPTIFSFGNALLGTYEILPAAYTIMALPLVLSSSQVAMDGVGENVEEASRSLGAGPVRTFARVVLPVVFPGILSGAILAFVRTIGEYTMSALLYGVYNRPISVSMVTTMQEYEFGVSMAYGALVIALCIVLLLIVLRFDSGRFGIAPMRSGGRASPAS